MVKKVPGSKKRILTCNFVFKKYPRYFQTLYPISLPAIDRVPHNHCSSKNVFSLCDHHLVAKYLYTITNHCNLYNPHYKIDIKNDSNQCN